MRIRKRDQVVSQFGMANWTEPNNGCVTPGLLWKKMKFRWTTEYFGNLILGMYELSAQGSLR